MTAVERWAPVLGAEGRYEVSDLGRVRSLLGRSPRILKPSVGTNRYLSVNIYDGSQPRRRRTIHQLVAEAFLGAHPTEADVRHLNGIKSDCRAVNLAYGTRSENMLDLVEHGGCVNANKTQCSVCGTPLLP